MKALILIASYFLVILTPVDARALFEVRGHAGLNAIDSTHFNRVISGYGLSNIYALGEYGIDAFLEIPGGLLLGARYEWTGIKVSSGSNEVELSAKRYSAAIGYRLSFGISFLSLIGTYGFSHTPTVNLKINNVSTQFDSGSGESVSGGIEYGMKFGPLLYALECGLMSFLIKDLKNASTLAGYDLNLGSAYGRFTLGLAF